MAKRNKRKTAGTFKSNNDGKRTKTTIETTKKPPIPVTILSGFLGSGKTTVLQYILTSKEHGLKIAVIVNDMAELNVDGDIIKRTRVTQTQKEVVTLENGCICCTLRGDLIREIHRIQREESNNFDYVLIESTGIAEPQQVAESFWVDPETQAVATAEHRMLLRTTARLDTCVTVVDAVNFPNYLSSLKRFKEIFRDGLDNAEEDEGEKSISELMVEQVEFANVVLLNKVDLVSEKKIRISKALIESLNPKARILNTHSFDMKEASESRGWLLSLKDGVNALQGEADEYGVRSFVYRARRPFHPLRLHMFLRQLFCYAEEWNDSLSHDDDIAKTHTDDKKVLENLYGSIMRSKGSCWIAGRDDHEMGWTQTGRILQLSPTAAWYCRQPHEEWDVENEDERGEIQAKFQGTDCNGNEFTYEYGDRRQEIVFIGTDLRQETIEDVLNKCLLTETEMKNHSVDLPIGMYPDPLQPVLVVCDGPRNVFMKVRAGQNQHIRVIPGFNLTLQHMSLNVCCESANIRVVKVWLDKTDSVHCGMLLVTLRPNDRDQHSLSVDLLPCDEQGGEESTNRRIRLEVITQDQNNVMDKMELMKACEVHVVGK
eukprot:scaffold9676_cov200-Amphora_coffeaeformis.AAC.6